MIRLPLICRITFGLLLATACHAESTVSDDEFFDFIRADVKKAPVPPPPVKTPTEAEAMLEKWRNYEQTRTEKQKADTAAARKILVEMLLKKSLTATPEGRAILLAESERIKGLAPDAPLLCFGGSNTAKFSEVVGKWVFKYDNNVMKYDYTPTGEYRGPVAANSSWHWVDEEAGVIATKEPKFANLCWLEKPGMFSVVNCKASRFKKEKSLSQKLPAPDPAVTNLNATESTQRQALSSELLVQRQRVINWLLDKAKQMSVDEMAQVVAKVHTLETQAEQLSDSVAKLKGKWNWENKEITFQAGGIIANRAGQKVGRWSWLAGDKANFAVVFNGAKATGKDIFLTKSPADDTQTTFEAHRLSSGHISVTRKLP